MAEQVNQKTQLAQELAQLSIQYWNLKKQLDRVDARLMELNAALQALEQQEKIEAEGQPGQPSKSPGDDSTSK